MRGKGSISIYIYYIGLRGSTDWEKIEKWWSKQKFVEPHEQCIYNVVESKAVLPHFINFPFCFRYLFNISFVTFC